VAQRTFTLLPINHIVLFVLSSKFSLRLDALSIYDLSLGPMRYRGSDSTFVFLFLRPLRP